MNISIGRRPSSRRVKPQRHQWFDAWRTAKGDAAKKLVSATEGFVSHHEEHTAARTRARRPTDALHHRQRIEALVCNLAHAVLLPPPSGRIAVKLGNGRKGRSRYDSPVMGKPLSPLVSMLWDLDFLDLHLPSARRGEVTSISPSAWFTRKVSEYGVRLSDFGRKESEEVILLTRNVRGARHWRQAKPSKVYREPIDYADTPLTRSYRSDVTALNAFLSQADIDFVDDGLLPRIDPFERTLRRRFLLLPAQDVRFDQGGRLFGGFWQNLKSDRRGSIRINKEPVAILDYSSMFTRLAYAKVGAVPPAGDLYGIPGLEDYRSGVKLAMNTLLFDSGPRRSWPAELAVGGEEDDTEADPSSPAASVKGRLPEGWSVAKTKKAILSVHPVLKSAWGQGLGYHLMFQESEILIAVLKDLASRDIPALALHDGLMVAMSKKGEAMSAMAKTALEATGISIPITEKPLGIAL